MTVTLALNVVGTDDDPRWVTRLPSSDCCEDGHYTPEAAAAHGSELAAVALARDARQQAQLGTIGAAAIAKLEAA